MVRKLNYWDKLLKHDRNHDNDNIEKWVFIEENKQRRVIVVYYVEMKQNLTECGIKKNTRNQKVVEQVIE